MTKQSGLGDNLYAAGYDLSGDIGSLGNLATPRGVTEVTGIDKDAFERRLTHKDGAISYQGWFNPAADQLHERASALPTADQIVTYCRGTTLGKPALCMVSKQLNYDGTRNADGSLTFAVSAQANGFGAEWGEQLTAGIRTDSAATDGASIDTGASAAFGLQAYLHVFSFTGTDVTITIEDSADDSAFAAVTDGAFTEVTAGPTSERIQTERDATIRRYLRVATSTTSGFSDLQFAVTVIKNIEEVTF